MALEEPRITVIYLNRVVTVLGDIIPTLPKTSNPSRIVLDADGRFPGEGNVDKAIWSGLDAVFPKRAEKASAKHRDRRLALQFRTDEEGATDEHDRWARELVGSLVSRPQVGDVEYLSKH